MDSELIRTFYQLISLAEDKIKFAEEQVRLYDMETQDILHDIELNDEWCEHILEDLRDVRRARREYKDTIMWYKPILKSMNSEGNLIEQVNMMLELVESVETQFATREYRIRVTGEEICE